MKFNSLFKMPPLKEPMSDEAWQLVKDFHKLVDKEIISQKDRIEQCIKELFRRSIRIGDGCLEIHVEVEKESKAWSPSISRIFRMLVDGSLMEALRACMFSQEFRQSLTDTSEFTDLDSERREKLTLLLHEFELKTEFSICINLQHLVSQLFRATGPEKELGATRQEELVLTLAPVTSGIQEALPDLICNELADLLSSPIATVVQSTSAGKMEKFRVYMMNCY